MTRIQRRPTLRLATLLLSTLPHQAHASRSGNGDVSSNEARSRQVDLNFPDCVSDCVQDGGCRATDAKCMCKASRKGSFLPDVVTCMYSGCSPDVTVGALLSPLEVTCAVLGLSIPSSAVASAEAAASSAQSTPAPAPSSTTVVVVTASTGKTTATTDKATTTAHTTVKGGTTSTTHTTAASTSVEDSGDGTTTTVTSATAAEQTTVATSSTSGSSTGTATNTGGSTDATDSSPFANTNSSARELRGSLMGAVLGLAAVLVLGW